MKLQVKSILKAKGKGSAQDNINLATFESEKFPFPPLENQLEIIENLQEIRSAVRQLEAIYQKKLTALAELKQSMLQKAFSGELTADPISLTNAFKEEPVT
ncbi:restriction endonuclease subunit S [Ectothiorhodospira haloalkaliphila]|uniref:restriction endonuclease subunit S n=1 Tax=Ectothiorhodospira haloalkaliphila TaxID=421628 RepID=UPI000A0583F2|nr:restriction endonuclease subunit S [Ectothiorhodospira haloalkaliphila]